MKVINVFAQIFAIFSFLTLGSLLIIVALHVLSVEDAIYKIRELYDSPLKSVQTGIVGLFFIVVGLIFSKMLVKKGRESDAIIFQSEIGPMIVSVTAVEDIAKKALKRFHMVKEGKIKTMIHGKDLEIKIRLVLWSGAGVPKLMAEIQDEVGQRVRKILGPDNRLEVICDVIRIEDHEGELPNTEASNDQVISA
ncbi:MAG TPA: hypothetical protein VL688_03075 [Verrucomicrobiae bacterium]|jgi:hypothetical protein|nr:hypothetical protein [Verrucomicrobiae bacterium]